MGFMQRLQHSRLYKIFLGLTRVLQFLSAIISLGLFSARIAKVIRLYRRINTASGAVEGILCAAVVYTILATILQLALKAKAPKWIRWLLIALDVAFIGAFIAVAVLTRPNGPGGPCRREVLRNIQNPVEDSTADCQLPWGTFILAIISTLLHAITAAFHESNDILKQHRRRDDKDIEHEMY